MALTSPALTLAVEAMFGNIKPTLNALKKLGVTDFSAEKPAVEIKPGMTIKVPVSSVSAASEYNASTNNYRTGGDTDWATLTAKHYLQGFDITGVNVDQGVDASRMKQLFTARAGTGIAMAIQNVVKTSIDGVKTSTAASGKIAPVANITMEGYMGIGDGLIPDNLNTQIYSHICVVTDEEALETSRRLAREEGLMVGISSGTNVFAALKLAKRLGPGKTVVTILPDTAERYFSTPLFV